MVAKDNIKVKVISEDTRKPVSYADIQVEYADTIINYKSDRKGKLSFTPSSFPLTVTAHAEGMERVTFAYMAMPSKSLKIEMTPDPSAPRVRPKLRVDWSTATPRRLRSTFVVRHNAKKLLK